MHLGSIVSTPRTSALVLVAVLLSTTARAQTVSVTSGLLDMNTYSGPLLLGGDGGFTFQSFGSNIDGIYEPENCNTDPNRCTPGHSVNLRAFWNGSGASGTATLDGVTYRNVGGQLSSSVMTIEFSGSAVLPPIAPSATITAPFVFSGSFSYPVDGGRATATRSLAGSGTAIISLKTQAPFFPNSWYVNRVQYVFGSTVPFPWMSADVGDVDLEGSASYSSSTGSFSVAGSGADIWGTADAFRFTSQLLAGNGEIIARVSTEQATHPFAKAGVMLRQSYDSSSPHVILDIKPDGGIEFMARTIAGAGTTFIAGAAASVPVWLKLTRTGSTVTGSFSTDGSSWSLVGSTTLTDWPSAARPIVGLAVTSHNPAVLNQSGFDHVSVTAAAPPPSLPQPWTDTDVGAVSQAGGASFANGTFTVRGNGSDIWGTADAFHYVYQPLNGDGEIVARVTAIQNTNQYAKAGLMIRQSLGPGSRDVILNAKPDTGIEFMTRATEGGPTSYVAGGPYGWPLLLRLVRSGSNVTGYVSDNGSTWTTIGTVTVAMTASTLVGLAVTSHTTDALNTSTFDNVTVTPSAPPPPASGDIVVHAQDILPGQLHGGWTRAADSTAAGGVKLVSADAAITSTAMASPTPDDSYVDVTFNASAGIPYTLWLQVKALNNNKFNDSLWVQFSDAGANGAAVYRIGTTSALLVNLATDSGAASLSGWGWVNGAYWLGQPATFTFPTTGPRTVRIQVREDGVQFDQMVLSPSRYFSAAASCPAICDGAPGSVSNDVTIVPKP